MRCAPLRSHALARPLLELPVDLVEPDNLVRIENFPDPVAGLLMEGLELRSELLLQLLMLFFCVVHDLAELLGLRVRQIQLPRQATVHHAPRGSPSVQNRSEEHTSELQSLAYLVCRLLLEKKKKKR